MTRSALLGALLCCTLSACVPAKTVAPKDDPLILEPLHPVPEVAAEEAWLLEVQSEELVPAEPLEESVLAKILRSHPDLQEIDRLYVEGGRSYFDQNLDLAEEYFYMLKERLELTSAAGADSLALLYVNSMQRKADSFAAILSEERFFSDSYAPASLTLVETYQSLRAEYNIPAFLLPAPEVTSSQFELQLLEVDNAKVDRWVEYFSKRAHKNFQIWLDRRDTIGHVLSGILEEEELPDELIYLAMIESGLSAGARSRAAAVGYWQFIRGTARNRGLVVDEWLDERRDIQKSTRAASRHLKLLYGMFGDWPLALAAYNAGEYRIQRAIGLQGDPDYWELRLPRETREYVPKFIAAARVGMNREKYGFVYNEVDSLRYDVVELDDAYSLDQIAKASGVKESELRSLNPQLLAACTPPQAKQYSLRVPSGLGEATLAAAQAIPQDDRLNWRKHRVSSGETIGQLARRYRTSTKAIMSLNGIRDARRVRAGRVLTIPYPRGFQPPQSQLAQSTTSTKAAPKGRKNVSYSVRGGDTLIGIAQAHGISVRSIRSANSLRGSRIYAGQKLTLPVADSFARSGSGAVSKDTHDATDYVVRSGDTLSSIGKRFSVNVGDLLQWNQLSARGIIRPGDRIRIWQPRTGSGR